MVMTVDERMLSKELYEDKLSEKVTEKLLDLYEDLALQHVDSNIVQLHDLMEFTYGDLFIEMRDEMIEDSVKRKDYDLHGMSEDEYLVKCYSGMIEHESVIPYIEYNIYRDILLYQVAHLNLFVQTNEGFDNEPLQEVW